MRFPTLGDKPNFVSANVRNDEASATIPAGSPVVLSNDGTEDGLSVVLPTSSTAAKIGAFSFGVAVNAIEAGKIGEVYLNGVFASATIVHATRAASTDSFASYAAGSSGAVLGIVSVANALSVLAASTASFGQGAFLMQSFASLASSASTTANTGTIVSSSRKVFLRFM